MNGDKIALKRAQTPDPKENILLPVTNRLLKKFFFID